MNIVLYPEQLKNIRALMASNKKIQAMNYVKDAMRPGGIILCIKEVKVLVEAVSARRYIWYPTSEYSIVPEGAVIVDAVNL